MIAQAGATLIFPTAELRAKVGIRLFAYVFMCLRQHGTFSLFLVIFARSAKMAKKMKNLLE
jgi:hypothetical protein